MFLKHGYIYYIVVKCFFFLFVCLCCSDWSSVLVNHAGNIVYSHTDFHVHKDKPKTEKKTKQKTKKTLIPLLQVVNFALIPPVARTTFLGGIAMTFTIYLCHLRQQPGHKFE